MRRLFLTTAVLLVFAPVLRAQVPYDTERNQGIGVGAGAASGAGFFYQEILRSGYGYRGALALWKKGDFSFINFGASGLRVLTDDGRRRIWLVASAAYWRSSDEEIEEIFDAVGNLVAERVFDDVDDTWALGLGVGIELPLGDRVGLSLEGVFTYLEDTGDLLPLPQIGLLYQF